MQITGGQTMRNAVILVINPYSCAYNDLLPVYKAHLFATQTNFDDREFVFQ